MNNPQINVTATESTNKLTAIARIVLLALLTLLIGSLFWKGPLIINADTGKLVETLPDGTVAVLVQGSSLSFSQSRTYGKRILVDGTALLRVPASEDSVIVITDHGWFPATDATLCLRTEERRTVVMVEDGNVGLLSPDRRSVKSIAAGTTLDVSGGQSYRIETDSMLLAVMMTQ